MTAFTIRPGSKGGLIDFNANLKAFADSVDATVEVAARKIAQALYNGVVQRTPVDTGFARSQWQILLEGDEVAVRPVGDHTAEDLAKLSTFTTVGTGSILIANGAIYIKKLEYEGHSQQAPEGMARVTLAEVQAQMDMIMKAAAQEAAGRRKP
ncbi:hypothetical protein TSA6c_16925 [Azospirillum sp. TSA6c]|uniref:HK97 gp10 family phage protein n=1 Tax=Azospirillum sp. TSA6c TaxID=709813 RepID=UPI000D611631|nr:HK97 gp10 family phage protein [Azospirillum sp. TSA6c]PWC48120.1 hypothetical protein TSA6c_16925 [Azospirillum sp. TSA6c]